MPSLPVCQKGSSGLGARPLCVEFKVLGFLRFFALALGSEFRVMVWRLGFGVQGFGLRVYRV